MQIAHFWGWNNVARQDWQQVMERFAACGHTEFAMNAELALQTVFSRNFCNFLKNITAASGTAFTGMHAPFAFQWDLLCDDPEFATVSRYVHTHLLEIMPDEFGIHSYTIHLRNSLFTGTQQEADELLERNLVPLLKVAERKGVTIAIENGFQPVDLPETLLHYMEKYASKNFGCCLDVAHAHVTACRAGKDVTGHIRSLLPYIIVAHLHDNDGTADQHLVPGTSTGPDWQVCMPLLTQAPRLQTLQNESDSSNWSIEDLCAQINRTLLSFHEKRK